MIEVYIGLEIHIQLLTRSKVFCSCPTAFGEEENLHVCPVCLGYPGVLPVLNRRALQLAYRTGLALKCTMADQIIFDRKNYFYPDMAKNYQISQFNQPVGVNGQLEFEGEQCRQSIRIHDIHLEEDAGKMIHGTDGTLLDYNRAGSSLLEVVTEPDFRSGREAELFLQYFRTLVRYLGVCDGNMEEGSLRCDANVSVNHPGGGLGTKVEIKNLNSSRFVRKALEYEIRRQSRMLRTRRNIVQETRLWDEQTGKTESMRSKEEAQDYRYFPEPDLPPFTPDEQFIREVQSSMPELPVQRLDRLTGELGLPKETAWFLTEELQRGDFYDRSVAEGADPQDAASWIKGELAKLQGQGIFQFTDEQLTPRNFARLLGLLREGDLTAVQAKQVLSLMVKHAAGPDEVITRHNIGGTVDEESLRQMIQEMIGDHPDTVQQIKDGNMKAVGFFMGIVMKKTKGAADPKGTRRMLFELMGISQS